MHLAPAEGGSGSASATSGGYRVWPRVKQFLVDLEPGSLICDVGEVLKWLFLLVLKSLKWFLMGFKGLKMAFKAFKSFKELNLTLISRLWKREVPGREPHFVQHWIGQVQGSGSSGQGEGPRGTKEKFKQIPIKYFP